MKWFIKKLSSRKFLTMIAGVLVSIVSIINGDVTSGAKAATTISVAYIISEGFIDFKAIKANMEMLENEEKRDIQ